MPFGRQNSGCAVLARSYGWPQRCGAGARDRRTQFEHRLLANEFDTFGKPGKAFGVGGLCGGQAAAQAAHYGSKDVQFLGMFCRGGRWRLDDYRLPRHCIDIGYFLPHILWQQDGHDAPDGVQWQTNQRSDERNPKYLCVD